MGCHIFDSLFSGLGLRPPLVVESRGPAHTEQTFALDGDVHYTFAGTPMTTDEFTLRWTHGRTRPDAAAAELPAGVKLPGSGSFVVGERGVMVLPHWSMPSLYRRGEAVAWTGATLEAVDHYHEWVAACAGGGETATPFSYAGVVTEAVIVGTVAGNFPNRALRWDSAALAFDDAEATALVRREYREGWRPPGV
jgi:hypothetical protein